jgi:two-component system KDP operon response regulator KdpE
MHLERPLGTTDATNGKVLIIEDDPAFRWFVRHTLAIDGYEVIEAETAQRGLDALEVYDPVLVVLDLGLPDIDGVDLIRQVRAGSAVPILVVSSRSDTRTQLTVFDLGADDYMSKPCTALELIARIRSSARTAVSDPKRAPNVLSQGVFTLDTARTTATLEGRPLELTESEFSILRELVLHAGKTVTQSHLLRVVWGSDADEQRQLLRICIRNVREKIERVPGRPTRLLTEPGIGYRLLTQSELP